MRFVEVPLPNFGKSPKDGTKKKRKTFPFFQIFPVGLKTNDESQFIAQYIFQVLTAMVVMWLVCALLTATGILPEENLARTDSKLTILQEAPWFNFPYPGLIFLLKVEK